MSASLKSMRRLVVDGVRYFWQTRGTDYGGIAVMVATEDAFVPGQRGQWLHFSVPYDSLTVAHESCWSLHQRARVTPGLVRRAIECALHGEPPFTGRAGAPDVELTDEQVRRVLVEIPLARIEADLERAKTMLVELAAAAGEQGHGPPSLVRASEVLLGHWLAIGLTAHLSPDGAAAVIDAWFERNAARIALIAPHLQAAVHAVEETLAKPWPAWQRIQRRCYERRSAIAFFVDLGRRAGPPEIARLDTAALDGRLRALTRDEGKSESPPEGIPRSHWWWRFALSLAEPA